MLILAAEKNGHKLKWLSDDDQHNSIVDIISEIKLITGAVLYDGDKLVLQHEMLKRFIVTGFSMLTKSEIVQAFYMNLQGAFQDVHVHYNKELNAEFIGNVLRAYLKWKNTFIRTKGEQVDAVLLPAPKVKREIDYDFFKEQVQTDLLYLKFRASTSTMWHERKYYTLRKFGYMPFKGLSTWVFFMRQALSEKNFRLNVPANSNFSRFAFGSVGEMRRVFQDSTEYQKCISSARMISYWYILQACVDCGINNIWEDVAPVK